MDVKIVSNGYVYIYNYIDMEPTVGLKQQRWQPIEMKDMKVSWKMGNPQHPPNLDHLEADICHLEGCEMMFTLCSLHVLCMWSCAGKKPSAFCSHIFVNSIMLNPMFGMFQPPVLLVPGFFQYKCNLRLLRSLQVSMFQIPIFAVQFVQEVLCFASEVAGLWSNLCSNPHGSSYRDPTRAPVHAEPPTNSLILPGKPPFFVDFHTKIWMFIQETSQPVCFNTAVRGIWRSSVGLGSIRASAAGFRLRSSWRIYPWSWKMCRPRCAWRRWKHMVPITSKKGYRTFMNKKRIQQISIYIYLYTIFVGTFAICMLVGFNVLIILHLLLPCLFTAGSQDAVSWPLTN